jgi:hypothetical protein
MRTATARNVVSFPAEACPPGRDAISGELPALAARITDRTASVAVVGLGRAENVVPL